MSIVVTNSIVYVSDLQSENAGKRKEYMNNILSTYVLFYTLFFLQIYLEKSGISKMVTSIRHMCPHTYLILNLVVNASLRNTALV